MTRKGRIFLQVGGWLIGLVVIAFFVWAFGVALDVYAK